MSSEAGSAAGCLLAAEYVAIAASRVSAAEVAVDSAIDYCVDVVAACGASGTRAEERRS